MSKQKSFTLRAFNVSSNSALKTADLLSMLSGALPDNSIAESRTMPLSNEDNADKDFLADFTKKKTHLFGIMMRTSPAKGIPEIDPELFKKHRITLSDLKINNASSSLCTDSYYFALDNEHLSSPLRPG